MPEIYAQTLSDEEIDAIYCYFEFGETPHVDLFMRLKETFTKTMERFVIHDAKGDVFIRNMV